MLGMFFFFKQKTAYEMLRSLVGSEMCIRDRVWTNLNLGEVVPDVMSPMTRSMIEPMFTPLFGSCLLYTSDAADDLLCVDLGGRRIIKKKKP